MKAIITLSGILALVLALLGCAGGLAPVATVPGRPANMQQPVATAAQGAAAATVNGQAIAMDFFQAQFEAALASFAPQPGLDPKSVDVQAGLRQQVLEMLIDQALVDQAAAQMGIVVGEEQVLAEVERIRGQTQGDLAGWLRANGYTEQTFRAQVRSDLLGAAVRDKVTAGVAGKAEQVHLRQIVVDAEAEARTIVSQLRAGQATFESLAGQRSIDEDTRATGGDLGYVPRGILPLSVENVAFALTPGQVGDPLQGPLGWYVLKLEARDPARDVPPAMLNALRQEAFMRWLDGERGKAVIERFVK